MSVEIAWKQDILVTDFHLLKSLLVVFGFGSQAFICGFSRQNINSVDIFLDRHPIFFDLHYETPEKILIEFYPTFFRMAKPPTFQNLK